jgi:hypothetical protein
MATFIGTSGPDILQGTGSGDTLTGGIGNDIFVYSRTGPSRNDVVTDFGATYYAATISGAQETPANASGATGTATAMLRRGGSAFQFAATVTGLDLGGQTATTTDDVAASHFHAGPPGVAGGVVFGYIGSPNNETGGDTVVNPAAGTVSGKWDAAEGNNTTLSAQLLNILSNRLYINFHTGPFPAGEIRGQMIAQDSGYDRIDLRGSSITDWAALQPLLSESGGSTLLSSTVGGQTYTMRLLNVPQSALTSLDFIFDGRGGATGYTTNQLATQFMNTHSGLAPNATQLGVLQNLSVSSQTTLTDSQTQAALVHMANNDTAVAVYAYNFFIGATPTQLGLSYLVNSSLNPNDLNDPYYTQFNLQNRAMNFAENLAMNGDGAARFQTTYGALTFDQSVDAAYSQIVGSSQAAAAGINVSAALADIKGRVAAFQQIAHDTQPAANQDLATKAAAIGYIMAEAIRADVGLYAHASDNFLLDLTDGSAAYGVNLVGVYEGSSTPLLA